jgi:sodium-dependent dicarboxylate transporter 2/3/5
MQRAADAAAREADRAAAGNRRGTAIGLGLSLAIAVATLLAPTPEGLTWQARNLVGVMAIGIVLWVSEALPIAATSLLVVALLPIFQVTTPVAAIAGTMTPVFFFVLVMFCIAQVVIDSGLARRFALALLTRAGTDSRRVVLAFMVGAALMSMIVSDVPVTAVWMSMALPLLARVAPTPGSSPFAKALMIGIPFASYIGGVGTPAGSSINILGLFQIEQFGRVEVSFLQWMAIGMPSVIILTPVAWWVLVWWFKPEVSSVGNAEEMRAEQHALGAWSSSEKKVVGILSVMIALWIASSWFRAIDTTVVAIGGAVLMFAPGINLLTWQRAQRTIGWDILLLIGGVTALGAAAGATGLAKYLVAALPDMTMWPAAAVIGAISIVTVLLHLPLPVNPAIVGVLIPPIALLALSTGQNPALYTLPVVFMTSCGLLLPLDAVTALTYAKGYYRMTDMIMPGALISLVWVIVMTMMMMWVAPAVGLI